MPDIIATLTTNKNISTKNFEEVMKFLLQFIVKEQHKEMLIEKLCIRFQQLKRYENLNMFKRKFSYYLDGCTKIPESLAFCVLQLLQNERCFRRLTDHLYLYKEFLRLPQVYKHFIQALSNFKKNSSKILELKVIF